MNDKVVYLMRGLPACGKSYTARQLAGQAGAVLETDEFFYTQVGDDPARYDYSDELLPEARRWNFARFRKAIAEGRSPIVVDRGNGLNTESQKYALHAIKQGYRVTLQEPESEWWREIRVLLKDRHGNREILYEWADRLAKKSRSTHRMPAATIRRWMDHWKVDLTVEEILKYPRDGGS